MRTLVLFLAIVALPASSNAKDDAALIHAREIVAEYLVLELEEHAGPGHNRSTRLEKLRELDREPEAGVRAIGEVLDAESMPVHRRELIEALGRLHTRESADMLTPFLEHEDWRTRREALLGLRRMARTVHRRGPGALPREQIFEPAVSGLVPALIRATRDEHENNREIALFALAETRDPAAHEFLVTVLEDPAANIRFTAAHLLVEFGDESGLEELLAKLDELVAKDQALDTEDGIRATRLLPALEELTGTSLGKIPMHPMLSSIAQDPPGSCAVFAPLLADWQAYWAAR